MRSPRRAWRQKTPLASSGYDLSVSRLPLGDEIRSDHSKNASRNAVRLANLEAVRLAPPGFHPNSNDLRFISDSGRTVRRSRVVVVRLSTGVGTRIRRHAAGAVGLREKVRAG